MDVTSRTKSKPNPNSVPRGKRSSSVISPLSPAIFSRISESRLRTNKRFATIVGRATCFHELYQVAVEKLGGVLMRKSGRRRTRLTCRISRYPVTGLGAVATPHPSPTYAHRLRSFSVPVSHLRASAKPFCASVDRDYYRTRGDLDTYVAVSNSSLASRPR